MSDDREKELFTARPPPGAEGSDVYSASTVASQAPADLLDLVREAEEAATLATGRSTPTSATKFHAAAAVVARGDRASDPGGGRISRPGEEFVDVGDEAIDAPPSLPPMRTATPHQSTKPMPIAEVGNRSSTVPPPSATQARSKEDASALTVKRAAVKRPTTEIAAPSGLPPFLGILLLFGLAIGALFLVTR